MDSSDPLHDELQGQLKQGNAEGVEQLIREMPVAQTAHTVLDLSMSQQAKFCELLIKHNPEFTADLT